MLIRFRLLLGCVALLELALEALDATGGVDNLGFAGEEGVAVGADFEDDVALVGGAGLEVVAARAAHGGVFVLRMDASLRHGKSRFRNGLQVRRRGSLATVRSRHIDCPVAQPLVRRMGCCSYYTAILTVHFAVNPR